MFKKMISILAALVLSVSAMGTAAAQETQEEIQFTGMAAEQLWAETVEGKTVEEMMEAAREEGLAHPVTEESLADSGARIDRENGVIYMIRSDAEIGKAGTSEEATQMAWSLVSLLGGEKDIEMELYARLGIGEMGIYCFSQTRNGEAMYGRMLKIMADADGDVHTVVSSLGFPEETDETLGVEEDLLSLKLMETETPDVPDFAKMIPAEWSCEAEISAGEIISITVPVAQDPETGLWYLADPQRKIVLGDFRKMVIEGQKDCLLFSEENAGWDAADVLVYYRILQCWDYYAQTGWIGPDGLGTPVLVLNNLCTITGESMENACYIGPMQDRWQVFAYSQEVGFGKCLDVLAHEYTHCITETSAVGGMYKDDYGAINEAISDILGNICEMRLEATADRDWYLGENLGEAFRSMSDPHEYSQPEYVWDQYYAASAMHPNDINDRGGVHTNSSILNYTASRLCLDEGMTLEEATDFWMAVDLGLTSHTDYFQMPDLMEWALETVGLEKYAESVKAMAEKTRMTLTERPEALAEGLMLVELSLPDTEAMKDHGWVVMGIQVDTWGAARLILDLLHGSTDEEVDLFGLLEALVSEEDPEMARTSLSMQPLKRKLAKIFQTYMGWPSDGNETMTMVMEQGLTTFYFLINMDPGTLEIRTVVPLIGKEWMDILSVTEDDSEWDDEQATKAIDTIFSFVVDILAPDTTEHKVLPVTGLENIQLPQAEEEP